MATVATAQQLLEEMRAVAHPVALREMDELRAFARSQGEAAELQWCGRRGGEYLCSEAQRGLICRCCVRGGRLACCWLASALRPAECCSPPARPASRQVGPELLG